MRGADEEMNRQMQDFVEYVRSEMLAKMQQGMKLGRRSRCGSCVGGPGGRRR